jgi:hypothetical protein
MVTKAFDARIRRTAAKANMYVRKLGNLYEVQDPWLGLVHVDLYSAPAVLALAQAHVIR